MKRTISQNLTFLVKCLESPLQSFYKIFGSWWFPHGGSRRLYLYGAGVSFSCMVFSVALGVFAEEGAPHQVSQTSQTQISVAPQKFQDINVTTFIKTSLNENPEDPLATSSAAILASSLYKLTDQLKLSLNVGLSQGINREQKTELTNFQVSLAYGQFPLGPHFEMIPQATLVFPTNSKSRYEYSYLGELSVAARVSSNFLLFGRRVSFLYTPSLSRLLHRYVRTTSGSPNLQYKLSHSLAFSVPLMESLSLDLKGGWMTALAYQGQIIEVFSLSQGLLYAWSEKVAIGLGHTNEASPFEYNGRDSNVRFYDWRTSTVFGNLSVNF